MSSILSAKVITACHKITLKRALQEISFMGLSPAKTLPELIGPLKNHEVKEVQRSICRITGTHWRMWTYSLMHFRDRSLSIWSR